MKASLIELITTVKKKGKTYDEILFISVKEQKMYHIVENAIVKEYHVSTAKKGVGNQKHRI